MTTIAYRAGIIAADSLAVINNNRCPGECRKIWRMKDGCLLGISGELNPLLDAITGTSAMIEIRALPPYGNNGILCVSIDGQVRVQENGKWHSRGIVEYYAIGSGSPAALGALASGASAEQAIKAAAETDVFTGGPIHVLTFGGGEMMPPPPPPNPDAARPPAVKSLWKRLFA